MSLRPRRSLLYVPGDKDRALEKARGLPVDGLILDLEDSVAPDAKPGARIAVAETLSNGGFGHREVLVRLNAEGTPWHDEDWSAVAGADGALLPKVESPETVQRAAERLPPSTALWCMLETPIGILRANEIAGASPRLAGLVMGTSDLVKDLGARHTADRSSVLTALSLSVLAARAHGLVAIDGVHTDLQDDAGFEAACRQGRDLGFDGKSLIHPKTIAAANAAFGPDEAEIAEARKIITAFDEAEQAGKGVTVSDGKLVEALHVQAAERTLAIAQAIAQRNA
ncbi:MAG: CoA ester lyase [Pseudomonadota bacterium]